MERGEIGEGGMVGDMMFENVNELMKEGAGMRICRTVGGGERDWRQEGVVWVGNAGV